MTWTWRLEGADGSAAPEGAASTAIPAQPTQSDAESWLGENWRQLADEGVAAVTLLHDATVVYGPMPLTG